MTSGHIIMYVLDVVVVSFSCEKHIIAAFEQIKSLTTSQTPMLIVSRFLRMGLCDFTIYRVALEVDVIVFTSRMFIQCSNLFLHDQMFTADCTRRFLLQPQFEI
jgi:hypothetical protein